MNRQIINPSFCCGCRWWNYTCTLESGEPCGNSVTADEFLRTAHTGEEVNKTIEITLNQH